MGIMKYAYDKMLIKNRSIKKPICRKRRIMIIDKIDGREMRRKSGI